MFNNIAHLFGRSGVARLKMTSNVVLIALLVLVLSVSVYAQDDNVLVIGTEAPVNLDPAIGSNDQEALFNRTVYDFLVDVTVNSDIAPALAESWEISDDGLTYTFTLREGVTFHDGSSFGPEDVVFTFDRLKELESSVLSRLGEFTVEAGEGNTVVFTLTQPNADFLYAVGARFTAILSSDDMAFDTGVDANGTGAFSVSEYVPGERTVFVANEAYWGGAPSLAGVEHVYIEDKNAQVDALLSGDVDFIFKLSLDQIARIEGEEGFTVLEVATNQHPVIRLHANEGAIGEDVRVRQAFKLATNREEINDILYGGRATIGNNDPIGPLYGQFYNDMLEQPAYDPEAACALIQEATGQERLTSTLRLPDAFGGDYALMAAALQQQWAEGCIDVDIEVFPEGVYYSDGTWLDTELGITGWGSRPTAQAILVEAYVPDAPYNESNWNDEEVGALVAEAGVTTDPEARTQLYHQISEIFVERGPIIVPFFAPVLGAVSNDVQGLEMNPFPGLTDVRNVSLGM